MPAVILFSVGFFTSLCIYFVAWAFDSCDPIMHLCCMKNTMTRHWQDGGGLEFHFWWLCSPSQPVVMSCTGFQLVFSSQGTLFASSVGNPQLHWEDWSWRSAQPLCNACAHRLWGPGSCQAVWKADGKMKTGTPIFIGLCWHLFFGSGSHYCRFSHPTPNQHLSLKCHIKLELANREKQNTVEVDGAKECLDNLTSSLPCRAISALKGGLPHLFLCTQLHFSRKKIWYDANAWWGPREDFTIYTVSVNKFILEKELAPPTALWGQLRATLG